MYFNSHVRVEILVLISYVDAICGVTQTSLYVFRAQKLFLGLLIKKSYISYMHIICMLFTHCQFLEVSGLFYRALVLFLIFKSTDSSLKNYKNTKVTPMFLGWVHRREFCRLHVAESIYSNLLPVALASQKLKASKPRGELYIEGRISNFIRSLCGKLTWLGSVDRRV